MKEEELDRWFPDFSLLPGVIWASIVAALDLNDRLNLAATCKSCYESVFNSDAGCQIRLLALNGPAREDEEPGTRVQIKALSNKWDVLDVDPLISNWSWTREVEIPKRKIRKSIGKMASHVSFTVDDNTPEMDDACLAMTWLRALDTSNLSVLTVRPCNISKSTFAEDFRAFILNLCELISRNATSLRELHFFTWPLHATSGLPSIASIFENVPSLKSQLRRFSYLWQGNDVRNWQPTKANYPHDDVNISLISSMSNLQHLNIPAQILTEELLLALTNDTNRSQFKRLRVCYSDVVHDVSEKAWQRFTSRHSDCRVEFSLMKHKIRAGTPVWNRLFRLHIPLAKITFMKHSLCEEIEMEALSERYHVTLDSFLMKSLNCRASSLAVLQFASRCVNLKNLVYFGPIEKAAIEKIISVRGSSWNYLAFVTDQINLADPRAEDQAEFFFERRKWYMEAEVQQEVVLKELCEKSKSILGKDLNLMSLKEVDWNVEHI